MEPWKEAYLFRKRKAEKKMSKTRTATWNKIGTDIKAANSIQEALDISNLNYEVVKAPVYLSNGFKIPDTFCTKKKNTNDVFGIVGKDYTIVQNKEAFSFVDSIVPEGLTFEKAGETSWMNYIIASLPHSVVLGDKVKPFIIFQNSHAGTSTLRAAICPLRIICQNQFTTAFKNATNKICLRHTSSIIDKMHTAQEVLAFSAGYMDQFTAFANQMAQAKVSKEDFDNIINSYFVVDEDASTRKINSVEEKKTLFLEAYNADDNQNFKGTKWGIINAFSDYITHIEPGRSTDSALVSKFTNVTLNTGLFEAFLSRVNA